MQRLKNMVLAGVISVSAALTGCAGTNVAPNESAKAADFKACLLTLGDAPVGSANAEAKDGLESAKKLLGISVSQVQLKKAEDIQKTVDHQISENCNVVLGIGQAFGDIIVQKSKIYRDRFFALLVAPGVDTKGTRDNIQVVGFDLTQPSYVSGYIAAGTTATGKVGVISDDKTPARKAIVAAFAQGVDRYNQKHQSDPDFKKVQINAKTNGEGTYLGTPLDPNQLRQETRKLVKAKTDVIFLAMESDDSAAIELLAACNRVKGEENESAGDRKLCPEMVNNPSSGAAPSPAGASAPENAENPTPTTPQPGATSENPNEGQAEFNALTDFTAIWYGNDGVKSQKFRFKSGKPPILTSVVMGVNEAVVWTIRDAKNRRFYLNNTQVVGDFKNHGVDISPFYDYDATVPNRVKSEVQRIIEQFRAGTLKVKMPPGSYLPGEAP